MKTVPVILQMEMAECGAASLAMVMAHHKKWVPLERLRSDCGVSRDGSTAKGIVRAARLYGFQAQGHRLEPAKLAALPLPCVIHWEMNHFVVLRGISKGYAHITDPACGDLKIPLERFQGSFTGIALAITPGDDFVPSGKPASVWTFARARLTGTAAVFAFVVAVSALVAVVGIIVTLMSRVFVDDLLGGGRSDWAYGFVGLFVAFQFLRVVLQIIETRTNLKVAGKFAVVSSGLFMWHVLRLPVDFYASRHAGDIATRQSENETISDFLLKLLAPLVVEALMAAFYLFVVVQYSVWLTLIGLSSLVMSYLVDRKITSKNVDISRVMARDAGKLGAMTVSGIELIETIKSAGAEDGFFEKWAGLHAVVNDSTVKSTKIAQYLGLIPLIVDRTVSILVLLTGAYLIMRGQLTVGAFFAFQGFFTGLLAPFSKIINARLQLQQVKVSMERVQDVLDYQPDVTVAVADSDIDEGSYKLSGRVDIENLTFGYNKLAPPVLDNFSLTLEPGGSVALVGASGCGKSTVAKLIAGLYTPWSGHILFDGRPHADIPREILTGSVSVVDQDIVLFQDSVNNNIKTWDTSIEDFEVILAARDAQIHGVIVDRDGGYGGAVLEGGRNFSGGERQRLEIAGALASDPTILILDEATSALDAKTEYDVMRAIRDRGVSTIVVAHRLSTIRDCDEIIVLDKGKVVQRGTHDALYACDGRYKELVSTT